MARIKHVCNILEVIIATSRTSQLQPVNELSTHFKFAERVDTCINQSLIMSYCWKKIIILNSDDEKKKLGADQRRYCLKLISLIDTIKHCSNENLHNWVRQQSLREPHLQRGSQPHQKASEQRSWIWNWRGARLQRVVCVAYNVSFAYAIICLKNQSVTIQRVCNNASFQGHISTIRCHFIFSVCGTAHSQQGASIDSSINYFDYQIFCRDCWVALGCNCKSHSAWYCLLVWLYIGHINLF